MKHEGWELTFVALAAVALVTLAVHIWIKTEPDAQGLIDQTHNAEPEE